MEYIVQNNGVKCPVIGIGTFMLSPTEAQNSVREALKMGYSLVDTANAYGARGTYRMKGTHHYEKRDGAWIAVNR